jgi:hypothetical protein
VKFMRQQARWKRSWAREATILALLIWRKPAPAAFAVYVGLMLPIFGPIVAAKSLIISPLFHHQISVLYPLGVYAMALTYGLYYAACQSQYGSRWWYGIVFVGFYLAFLLWQTYWAIATLRTAKWGTRPATAGIDGELPPSATAEELAGVPAAAGVLALVAAGAAARGGTGPRSPRRSEHAMATATTRGGDHSVRAHGRGPRTESALALEEA